LLATYLYRLGHELHNAQVPEIPDVIAALGRWMTGVEIYYSAEIGPGLKLIHGLSTVIGSGCLIGRDFTIYQGVTVGDALGIASGTGERPTLGDGIIACAGSAILGPVQVGDESIISANSVVLDSIPPRSIASGTPARVMVESLPDSEYQRYRTVLKG
jgi:serine O-acetyltransferase